MGKRIVFGLLLIAFLCGVFTLDSWLAKGGTVLASLPLGLLTAGLIVAGYVEFRHMMRAVGIHIPLLTGLLSCVVLGTMPAWAPLAGLAGCAPDIGLPTVMNVVLGLILGVLFLEQLAHHRLEDFIRRLGATFLAVGYLGICGYLVLSVRVWQGLGVFIVFVACVKCSDIGAYFAGKFLGRHKLIEWLSPKKTWEGLIGGMLGSAVAALVLGPVLLPTPCWAAYVKLVIFGLTMGLLGQGADLCESALKRAVGLKDAGAVVPEFGGVLDILDSLLLSAAPGLVLLEVLKLRP